MYEKKKLELFETLECVTSKEFNVELVLDESTFNKFELKEKFKVIIEKNNYVNPPDFPISDGCCNGAKKASASRVVAEFKRHP